MFFVILLIFFVIVMLFKLYFDKKGKIEAQNKADIARRQAEKIEYVKRHMDVFGIDNGSAKLNNNSKIFLKRNNLEKYVHAQKPEECVKNPVQTKTQEFFQEYGIEEINFEFN